jgi:hypothetical protein
MPSRTPAAALASSGIHAYAELMLRLQGVIKLSNAAMQKYPNEHVFKSLKAVALQRTGKTDEAMQVGQAACRNTAYSHPRRNTAEQVYVGVQYLNITQPLALLFCMCQWRH